MAETETLSSRTVRPNGMMLAAGWVGTRAKRSRLHLADCDYFLDNNPPRPATKDEQGLEVCQQCQDRMRRSLGDG